MRKAGSLLGWWKFCEAGPSFPACFRHPLSGCVVFSLSPEVKNSELLTCPLRRCDLLLVFQEAEMSPWHFQAGKFYRWNC